jgi:hypothetical protein
LVADRQEKANQAYSDANYLRATYDSNVSVFNFGLGFDFSLCGIRSNLHYFNCAVGTMAG